MTGAEIVGVGKAVASAGKAVLGEDEKTKDLLRRLAAESPEMQAAANAMANRIAVKQQILLKLFMPFARLVGVSRAYFDDQFTADMADKTEGIPEEALRTPLPSIAVPAMQGLSYSLEEPDLKDMYLNLLTTASDERRSLSAHPAFADIIKQLSANETAILNGILSASAVAMVRLREINDLETRSFTVRLTHFVNAVDDGSRHPVELPMLPMWIENWARLGLVEINYRESHSAESSYSWVTDRPEYLRLLGRPNRGEIEVQKGVLRRTAFGALFAVAVAPPPEAIRGTASTNPLASISVVHLPEDDE